MAFQNENIIKAGSFLETPSGRRGIVTEVTKANGRYVAQMVTAYDDVDFATLPKGQRAKVSSL